MQIVEWEVSMKTKKWIVECKVIMDLSNGDSGARPDNSGDIPQRKKLFSVMLELQVLHAMSAHWLWHCSNMCRLAQRSLVFSVACTDS